MSEVKSELLDVLDEQGQPTGQSKPREQVHKDGDWHRSFHLWIIREKRYVLMQRRARSKDLEGGKIDVSVGGHFRAGEGLNEVIREAEEEIGLYVLPQDLYFLGTKKVERDYEHAADREFQDSYVYCCDQALDHYHLNCKEVDVLYEIAIDKAITLHKEGGFAAVSGFDCQQRPNNALLIEDDLILQARQTTAETLLKIQAWLAD